MNSISFDPDAARLIGKGFRKASEAKLFVTPARFVCWVELDVSGAPVAVVNCHFISKPRSDPWRLEQWNINLRVLLEVVAELEARGFRAVVLGDINWAEYGVLAPLTEPHFREPNPTVDRIAHGSGVTVPKIRLGTNGGSNHQPIIATAHIKE